MTNNYYTLSIEDTIKIEGKVTERSVTAKGPNYFGTIAVYNPNADRGYFKPEGPFDTSSFSIVHPIREVAREIVKHHYFGDGSVNKREIGHNNFVYTDVNDAQKILFENILGQEYDKLKKEKRREDERYSTERECQVSK